MMIPAPAELVSGTLQTVCGEMILEQDGSAIIEFYYLNRILENGDTPEEAAEALLNDIAFAGSPGYP
ncbi:hypothetical protein CSA37_13380 [Candidatus Fermentibacteria bacterium]|nr:MAG: hypothetical protein CSA37_13380 [Candidatus Fermentibacteria bacterium]